MKSILSFLFLLCFMSSPAQDVDSFKVCGMNFLYQKPADWPQTHKDTGLCIEGVSNLSFTMPATEADCGMELTVTFSQVTDAEREARNAESDSTFLSNEDVLYDYHNTRKFYKFTTFSGIIETTSAIIDPNAIADDGTTKKKKKKKKLPLIFIHNYIAYYYFPINDTLELSIAVGGRIPHEYEGGAQNRLYEFAEYFFRENDVQLDSLLKLTDPYRFEPPTLPLDSVNICNAYFKFPLLPGWTYDTTRTSNEIKTNFLKIKSAHQDQCNKAVIALNFRKTEIDNKVNMEKLAEVPFEVIVGGLIQSSTKSKTKPKSDSAQKAENDSIFQSYEHHYYFSNGSASTDVENCDQEEHTETVYVYVYTQTNERIKITMSMTYVADTYQSNRDYLHAFYRFITLMADATDFEEFYRNSK